MLLVELFEKSLLVGGGWGGGRMLMTLSVEKNSNIMFQFFSKITSVVSVRIEIFNGNVFFSDSNNYILNQIDHFIKIFTLYDLRVTLYKDNSSIFFYCHFFFFFFNYHLRRYFIDSWKGNWTIPEQKMNWKWNGKMSNVDLWPNGM